jgi:hypothetical protein
MEREQACHAPLPCFTAATSMAAPARDRPTTLVLLIVLKYLTAPAPYPLAHTSDTTSTSLVSRVPDGSKRVVKSLANIFKFL